MSAEQCTILIAEDEAALRELLKKILHAAGYHLLIAADGKEALEIADQHTGPIDLLFSDIIMPEMSGLKLARAITTKRPETKVILTSANTRYIWAMDRSWRFIPKPYTPTLLPETIRETLNKLLEVGGVTRAGKDSVNRVA